MNTKIALIREYIDVGPIVFHQYINRMAAELLWDYSSVRRIHNFAEAARDYTEACYALEATTDSLAQHALDNPDIEALMSARVQNKLDARKAYDAAVQDYEAYLLNMTGPLQAPPLNW